MSEPIESPNGKSKVIDRNTLLPIGVIVSVLLTLCVAVWSIATDRQHYISVLTQEVIVNTLQAVAIKEIQETNRQTHDALVRIESKIDGESLKPKP